MELRDEAMDLITFGDARAFVMHVLKTYPDLVDEAIDSTPEFAIHLMEKLEKQPCARDVRRSGMRRTVVRRAEFI